MTLATLLLARLRGHPGRSLVLVAAIAVAAGIALSGLAVLRIATDPWAPLVTATAGGDVEIDEAPARPDPRTLAALPEVAAVGTLIESGDTALRVGDEVMLIALRRMPDRTAMAIDRPLLLTGRWFTGPDEVVFEATLADTLGVGVGEQVTLRGERTRTARVVGTAATTMMPNYPERSPASVFAGGELYDAVDPVGQPRWSVGLRLRDPAAADAVVARLNASGPVPAAECTAPGWCARTAANVRANAFPTRADSFAQIMIVFAVLMLVAAVLLTVTLLGSRLVSEARELTLLQVAGATPARLARLIAAEQALLAAVGVLVGAGIARLVAPRIADSAATVFGSVSPSFQLADVVRVGVTAVVVAALVGAVGGLRAGRRSLAVVVRGGTGAVHRSRMAALAMGTSAWATLVLGLKDIATRRGRAVMLVLSVALAVTMSVAVVGIGLSERDPVLAPDKATTLPAPADIADLPMFPTAVSGDILGRILALITALQLLLGAVAVVTLLAAASMSVRERLRELGVLHALGGTTGQLAGAAAISHAALGVVGTAFGVPLGLGVYAVFRAAAGGGLFTGFPPPAAVGGVAVAAVLVAAAAGAVPALLAQRIPVSTALAAE